MARTLGLFSGLAMLGGMLLLTPAQPLSAAKRPSTIETSLLGIRILSTYRTVLAKYGQPTRIYRSGEQVPFVFNFDANGTPTGGIRSLGDDTAAGPMMGGGMARGGRMGGMMGGPGMMGGGSMGGPGMMSSSMGGSMGMMRSPMQGSTMGAGGYQSMAMRGMMGGGSSMGGPGGMTSSPSNAGGYPGMGGGMAGGGLGASQGGSATFGDAGGFQWVYFYPKQELVYWFIFNSDKRVVAIIERGRGLGQKTSRGLGLGDSAKSVYTTYGWPDSVEQQGYSLALLYPVKHHVQFNLIKNKVTIVAVVLSETERYFSDEGGGSAPGMGGGLGMPGMARGGRMGGGMMGGPGMMSSSMGGMMGRPGMMGGGGISGGGKGD